MVDIKALRRCGIQASGLRQSRHRSQLGHVRYGDWARPRQRKPIPVIYCETNRTNRVCLLTRLLLEFTLRDWRLSGQRISQLSLRQNKDVTGEIIPSHNLWKHKKRNQNNKLRHKHL
jgi:hypothetical protein